MTATPELIAWVAANMIGAFVFGWLALISWERRIAVLVDQRALLREQRLHAATRQMRNRSIGFFAHNLAVIVGILPMFGLDLPYHGLAWVGIIIVILIITTATMDLYGEFRGK